MADAGANALLEVRANGTIDPLATFPDRMVDVLPFLGLPPGTQIPMDAVPTAVALGPDGNFYVGQLTGFPFPVGAANIYRVPAAGGTPEVFASGFTHIVDLTFGRDGSLYVVEIAKNGLLAVFDQRLERRAHPHRPGRHQDRTRAGRYRRHPAASPWEATARSTSPTTASSVTSAK